MLIRSLACVAACMALAPAAMAQTKVAPSPLPIFDLESGQPYLIESIIGTDSLEPVSEIEGTLEYDYASIVARVEDLSGSGFCTGFRIGEDLFMTNQHCWEVRGCDLQFHLGYEDGKDEADQRVYKCKEVLAHEVSLDFALYRVEPMDPDAVDIYPIGALSKQILEVDMPLMVPGHPAARTKHVDLSEECHLTRAEPYDWYGRRNIQHRCDTMGGSSGSPVLDRETGFIVGIHWGAQGGTGSNHAIPMTLILEYLNENLPEVIPELDIVE